MAKNYSGTRKARNQDPKLIREEIHSIRQQFSNYYGIFERLTTIRYIQLGGSRGKTGNFRGEITPGNRSFGEITTADGLYRRAQQSPISPPEPETASEIPGERNIRSVSPKGGFREPTALCGHTKGALLTSASQRALKGGLSLSRPFLSEKPRGGVTTLGGCGLLFVVISPAPPIFGGEPRTKSEQPGASLTYGGPALFRPPWRHPVVVTSGAHRRIRQNGAHHGGGSPAP